MLVLRTDDEAARLQVRFAESLRGAIPRRLAGDSVAFGDWLVDVPAAGPVTLLAVVVDGEAERLAGVGCSSEGMPLPTGGVLADVVRRMTAAGPALRAVA